MKISSPILVAILCSLGLANFGCNSETKAPPAANSAGASDQAADPHAGHEHAAEGPHKGHLIELGNEEYHAELVHDDATHTLTVYLLDNSADQDVATEAKDLELDLTVLEKPSKYTVPAVRQDKDPADKSSRFQLVDEKLCEQLDAGEVKVKLSVTIDRKPFVGSMEHHTHEDHPKHEDEKK